MNEQIKTYGKYAATAVVGVGVGLTGYAVSDTPTQQTDAYQNLNDKLDTAQSNADDFEQQVADLETTVTDKEDRISNLTAQVSQFETTVQELKDENADLEEAVASGEERTGLVDYFPVFTENTDVEYTDFTNLEVDQPADELAGVDDAEGDYTQIDVKTEDRVENHDYDVTVTQFESGEDADDYEENERDYVDEVSFSADGDEHTVGVISKESVGKLNDIHVEYEDEDSVEDVDDEDDIESVVVDGEDVTEDVDTVKVDGAVLEVSFDGDNYVNEGDEVSLTFSQADGDESPEKVWVNGQDGAHTYEYDQDVDQFVFRDGNTVVTGTGDEDVDGDEDDYDAQYEEFRSQYE